MFVRIRTIASVGLPAIGALISLLWYWKRRNRNLLDYPKPPDKKPSKKTTEKPAINNDYDDAPNDSGCASEGYVSQKEETECSEAPPIVEEIIQPKQAENTESCVVVESTNLSEDHHVQKKCENGETSEVITEPEIDTHHHDALQQSNVSFQQNIEPITQSTTVTPVTQTIHPVTSQTVSSAPSSQRPDTTSTTTTTSQAPNRLSQSHQQKAEAESKLTWAESVEQCNLSLHSTAEQSVARDSVGIGNHSGGDASFDQSGVIKSQQTLPDHQGSANTDVTRLPDVSHQVASEAKHPPSKVPEAKLPPTEVQEGVCVEDEVSKSMNNNHSGGDLVISKNSISSESPRSSSSNGSSENGSSDHDVHSVMSADSGLGNCNPVIPIPGIPIAVIPNPTAVVYEFDFPTEYCGQLIGKFGRNINRIKDSTGVEISVNKKAYTQDFQVIALEGSQSQIDLALSMIRDKFPPNRYPTISLEPTQQEPLLLQPEMMQLSLPEGVSVEALVSSVVAPNHVFLQQPTHPSFHMLERLNQCMNLCYAQENVVPELPRPIEVGMICAAPMYSTGWYRAQVVESYPERDEVDIKFVDYGGYMTVQGSLLRQIRSDFSALPFQAVECYMANVMPPKGLDVFPAECVAVMEQLVQGKLLQAQVVGHEENGVPYVQLYELQGDKTIFVNRELVNSGSAQWIEHLL